MTPADLLSALHWRYATKAFDPAKKLPAEIISALEESLVLTPSSYGLQPWKFLVITDKALREQLVPHSWGQRQVADCSHLIVFTIKSSFGAADVDAYIDRICELRGVGRDAMQAYRDIMVGDVVHGPRGKNYADWAKRQTYIALGQLMLSAAMLGVDACPMEGFSTEQYDEILGLPSLGLTTSVVCPLGYRAESDKYATATKVRFAAKDVIIRR